MSAERRAPSRRQVVGAIARRELGLAARRRMVRLLFLTALGPPFIMAAILLGRVMAKQAMGVDLGWDPILRLLQIQALPVALLCLGLGTPAVSRDRSEDVLYLYAVRPVSPLHYTLGKLFAVLVPAALLLFLPALGIVILREGILGDTVRWQESAVIVAKAAAAALLVASAYSGTSVGASALVRRGRWALLIALVVFSFPEPGKLFWGADALAVGPANAAQDLLGALFGEKGRLLGLGSAAVLTAYAAAGIVITRLRVAREMIP